MNHKSKDKLNLIDIIIPAIVCSIIFCFFGIPLYLHNVINLIGFFILLCIFNIAVQVQLIFNPNPKISSHYSDYDFDDDYYGYNNDTDDSEYNGRLE